MRKLFPKELTSELKRIPGEFILGIWEGMSPSLKRSNKQTKRKLNGKEKR